MRYTTYTKSALFIACSIILLITPGCIVPEGDRHEHGRYEPHREVIVERPEVVVRPPEVIIR